jgi:ribosome biogenesis protein BMS1
VVFEFSAERGAVFFSDDGDGKSGRKAHSPLFQTPNPFLHHPSHSWHPGKVLKTRDPLVVSIGWRRAQVVPVFATEDANGRHRGLKYTPEHAHCLAYAWFAGGSAPAGTGVLCFQAGAERAAGWRVAATGTVLGGDAAPRVVKKLKLVGEPSRVHRRTAFVRGLFNSQLEAARFEGAAVRTASGVRGIVKRAASARAAARAAGGGKGGKGGDAAAAGVVRATFEDKILISDVVFLRAWVAVDLPKLCIPVTDLLSPASARRAAALAGRREPKRGREGRSDSGAVEVEAGDKRFSKAPSAAVAPPPAAAFDAAEDFVPCSDFAGPRPGWFFGTRRGTGTGYYRDGGGGKKGFSSPSSASRRSLAPPTPGRAAAAGGGEEGEQEAPIPSLSLGGVDRGGWVAMRTVAELRRAAQLSAPRDPDSLYRPVERAAVRRFNPLRVPRALQAALPFASKQKAAAPRKRKDLDSRRAVALDAEGKRAASLVAQLNAIRNSKAAKKLLKQATKRAAHSKKVQEIEASKGIRRKEERKRKFVEEGRKERAAAKKSRGGGARD